MQLQFARTNKAWARNYYNHRMADHERRMREKKKRQERASEERMREEKESQARSREERRALQLARNNETRVKAIPIDRDSQSSDTEKRVACDRCKKIYSSVIAMSRHQARSMRCKTAIDTDQFVNIFNGCS